MSGGQPGCTHTNGPAGPAWKCSYTHNKKHTDVNLTVERRGTIVNLTARVNDFGRLGISLLNESQYDSMGVFKLEKRKYGFFAAFPAGFQLAVTSLKDYINNFKLIFKPSTEAYKGVSGFKGMASIFSGNGWDWQSFWRITAFFSIVLAFMNLLPIPALDGGYVMFLLYEMISGREPSEKFFETALKIGMAMLLVLMVFVFYNDIAKLFTGG